MQRLCAVDPFRNDVNFLISMLTLEARCLQLVSSIGLLETFAELAMPISIPCATWILHKYAYLTTCMCSIVQEHGATGNKGLSGLLANPVLATSVAGLGTSATAFAAIEVSQTTSHHHAMWSIAGCAAR